MRVNFTLCFIILIYASAWGQGHNYENFEMPNDTSRGLFWFDNTHHHNSWQIGKPAKTNFSSACSLPNALVTDTVNPYPINDTSVFTLKVPRNMAIIGPAFHATAELTYLSFDYSSNMDSTEFIGLELSLDTGKTWTNILKADTANRYSWMGGTPDFIKTINCATALFGFGHPAFPLPGHHDTAYFRFTFISDSIQTNKDGWMLDNFFFNYYYEGVDKIPDNKNVVIYPNPASNHFTLSINHLSYNKGSLVIYNLLGCEVYRQMLSGSAKTDVLCANLPKGVYNLKVIIDGCTIFKRLLIE